MCGRYALAASLSQLVRHFHLDEEGEADFAPRYNVAPMQFAPVVVQQGSRRHLSSMRWGLLPWWAEDVSVANRLINARAESAARKPAFRLAFKFRRCLVPVSGFYEWAGKPPDKQPYYIHLASHDPIGLAGLWEYWKLPDGGELHTFVILTTWANSLLEPVHERMPVIIPPEAYGLWLNPARSPDQLTPLLQPYNASEMSLYPVSKRVGNQRNDDESLLVPAPPAA